MGYYKVNTLVTTTYVKNLNFARHPRCPPYILSSLNLLLTPESNY